VEVVDAGALQRDGQFEPDRPGPDDGDVGRGAAKLRGALLDLADVGPLPVAGRRAIDVGASTGGFTQVLLERGARSVLALDVGHDQLAPALAADPRVTERSGRNVRQVDPADLGGPFELLVADLSFISLTVVLPDLAALVAPGGDLLLLVKPQFEIGRERLASDGVVRSEQQRQETVDAVRAVVPSQLVGASGNVELVLWARR
jgi:23S rRNA (cytidine1920-2'-O)/16S rRNA (cytidine1409-2'-O)-methyltransferase